MPTTSSGQRCKCAVTVYRNHSDGTRDYKLRGDMCCMICRGSGLTAPCPACGGAGMRPGNAICGQCRGCGSVPLAVMSDA